MLGYPILSRPLDPEGPRVPRSLLQGRARARASSRRPLEINDVWPENYSVNSAQKVWAAKFAARHPNVVVLDLSSFKCGHDAPTYGLIDAIVDGEQDAVRRAPRHRREQAGRLDQDPRQDVRPRAQAPRGGARGRGEAARASSHARARQEAPRAARAEDGAARAAAQADDPALEAQIEELARASSRAYVRPGRAATEPAPKGLVQARRRRRRTGTSSAVRSSDATQRRVKGRPMTR